MTRTTTQLSALALLFALSACSSTPSAESAPVLPSLEPTLTTFKVYRQEKVGAGLRVYVELPSAVSEEQVQRATSAVAEDYSSQLESVQLVFSLAGHQRPSIWATARYTPAPSVEILGLTPEFEHEVVGEFEQGEVVGTWMQYGADGGLWVLVREQLGGMKMHWHGKSGGVEALSVVQRKTDQSIQFCDLADSPACFTVTRRGDLLRSGEGAEETLLYRRN